MSQSESDVDLKQYRSSAGVESKTADIASDDHALKAEFGESKEQKSFKFDAEIIAERISNWYDSDGATVREFLSNAETACIRRAKMELQQAGEPVPTEIVDIVEKAKTVCGYEPLIEITYNRKPDDTRLTVEDNGCGINTEEYQVLRNIGYSASHSDGKVGDGFGMGIMSAFQLAGTHGMLKFSTRSFPTAERPESAYSVAMYVTNLEFLSGEPDEYGTRFEFPDFTGEAKDIDIPSVVEEFSEGMIVPVLYRDFDESGQETSRSDDYLPRNIEDDYPDDSLVVTYENEFFKAVMSPDAKEDRRGLATYNISAPIRRNTSGYGSNNKYNAAWKWDFRGKNEDGPIVRCPSKPAIEGLVPKEDTKYDRLIPDLREKCIPMSNVPDDAVVMPSPASSRDSFKGGHDDFWRHVSDKLQDEWASVAKKRFATLDSWDDFLNMSREEKHGLFRAYDDFAPNYSTSEPSTIQETIEDNLGLTLDEELCELLHESQANVHVVTRGSNKAHTKGACHSETVWKVIDDAPDGVYMGKTISQKKADIVWGLGDTHMIRLKSSQSYDELASLWGWEKAKDLPNRNLGEKLPELDDSVIERYDNVTASTSNNTSSTGSRTGGNGKDPKTYRGKVRVGSGNRKYFTSHSVGNLVDTLEDDDSFKAGRWDCTYLVIKSDDSSAKAVAKSASKTHGIGAIRVPSYVYDYLEGVTNVYTSKVAAYEDNAGVDVTLSDGTTMGIRDLPETDMLLSTSDKTADYWADRPEDLAEVLGYNPDEYERYTFIDHSDLDGSWDVETDATVVKTGGARSFDSFSDYTYKGDSFSDLKFKEDTAGMDKNSDEYEALFSYRYGEPSNQQRETLVEIAKKAGLTD